MHQNNGAIEEIKPEFDEMEIGENKPQVEPKKVVIEKYRKEPVTIKGKETMKLILEVKHPDVSDRLVDISGVKYQFGDKLKTAGLWLKQDNDGKLLYNSAVGNLLRFLKKGKVKELPGEQVETVTDEKNYLVVKAY